MKLALLCLTIILVLSRLCESKIFEKSQKIKRVSKMMNLKEKSANSIHDEDHTDNENSLVVKSIHERNDADFGKLLKFKNKLSSRVAKTFGFGSDKGESGYGHSDEDEGDDIFGIGLSTLALISSVLLVPLLIGAILALAALPIISGATNALGNTANAAATNLAAQLPTITASTFNPGGRRRRRNAAGMGFSDTLLMKLDQFIKANID